MNGSISDQDLDFVQTEKSAEVPRTISGSEGRKAVMESQPNGTASDGGVANHVNHMNNMAASSKPLKDHHSPTRVPAGAKENKEVHGSSTHKDPSRLNSEGGDKVRPSTNGEASKHSSSSKHSSGSSSSKHRDGHSSSSKDKSSSGSHSSRPKDGSSSSSSKHKEGSSSSSSKHRESSSSKHKEGSSSSKHGSSSSSSKPREGSSSSSSKHKEGSSSSSSKHGSSSSSSRPKEGSSSSSSKPKEGSSSSSSRPKEGSSSSSSKPKDGSSSSSSKHKEGSSSSSSKHGSGSSSSKHKEGSSSSSSKPKESSSGSSSKHGSSSSKHRESSSSRPKDGSSSKHREGSSSKPKEGSSSSMSVDKVMPLSPIKVKPEPLSPVKVAHVSPVKVKSPTLSPMKVKVESVSPAKVKQEMQDEDSDDDVPLSMRAPERKRPADDSDDEPLSSRANKAKKVKKEEDPDFTEVKHVKKHKVKVEHDDEPPKKKKKKKEGTVKTEGGVKPGKKKKKEEEVEKWRWWEEERKDDGTKWKFLEHKGPQLAPDYEPLPSDVKFYYDGHEMALSQDTEEVAGFYAKMLEHDYTTKEVFNKNFFKDWRKVMTEKERSTITDLKKCNFKPMHKFFTKQSEERKSRSKEEKQKLKEHNAALLEEFGFCTMDGHREKIGNFRIEPPGLFRGRGEHPKQGMHKKRIMPEDVIINCSKNSEIPKAPAGHKWKEVRHDNTVSWLASWNENIQGQTKYVMLNAASKLKGEKDWQKYEVARRLHKTADKIRAQYREDWKSKEMRIRQRSVALYFIDKLALRAGNEKEEGETADTVGCCSLRVEHINLREKMGDKENVVEFDFLGKDSIRYQNAIPVEKRVFKNLQLFMDNKAPEDSLFDRLNTAIMNKHLQNLMDGLTAKVFRTYNASKTLQEQLDLLTNPDDPISAKMLSYNRANRAVAVLCNHQRAAPKNFDKQMENMQNKIDAKKDAIKAAKKELKNAKVDYKATKTAKANSMITAKKKQIDRLEEQLVKLEVQQTDKDENKEIALGTSKLNYLDPRISIAWCKKWEVPIEKIYNKTQRDKFAWAVDMAEKDFVF